MTVVLLTNTDADEAPLQDTYSGPFLSRQNVLCVYKISQFFKFLDFLQNKLHVKHKIKILFQIFRCIIICNKRSTRNIQILAFAKINTDKNFAL